MAYQNYSLSNIFKFKYGFSQVALCFKLEFCDNKFLLQLQIFVHIYLLDIEIIYAENNAVHVKIIERYMY